VGEGGGQVDDGPVEAVANLEGEEGRGEGVGEWLVKSVAEGKVGKSGGEGRYLCIKATL
jgi:hypothetical protein